MLFCRLNRFPVPGIVIVAFMFVVLQTFVARDSAAQEFTQAMVRESVEKIGATVNEHYFDVELAEQIQLELKRRLNRDEFADVRTPRELGDRITALLDKMTQDKHLVVSPRRTPPKSDEKKQVDQATAAAERAERRELEGRRSNFGIRKFEILPGNIAYLDFSSFYRENEISELLAAEMKLAANADAVVLDMRDNMGGSTGAVSLLSSYFFEGEKRKLFEVVDRTGTSVAYWTNDSVANRNESRPLFVLVQSSTFSAGEGLAFIMQDQKRAMVIGETTSGAANPGRPYFINQWLEVNVPNGFIKAANGGGNWEGTGVTPDVNSKAKDALLVARRKAIEELIRRASDDSYRQKLESLLDELPPVGNVGKDR